MKVDVSKDADILEMALNDYEANGGGIGESVFSFDNVEDSSGQNDVLGLTDSEGAFMRDEFLKEAEELIQMGAEFFDESAKNKMLPGFGDIQPERFSRVAFLVAKRRIPTSWLENSPELTLTYMMLKILTVNGIELQKLKNNQAKKQGNTSE